MAVGAIDVEVVVRDAGRPGRLTAGETTRTSRSEAGMLISTVLYNRIVYDAFV